MFIPFFCIADICGSSAILPSNWVAFQILFHITFFPQCFMIAGSFLKQANGPTDTLSFFSWLNVHICPPSPLFLTYLMQRLSEQVFSIVVISCNLFQNGDTALHIAAAMGRRKLTKILLESGCDKESKNKQGETSLEISRRKNLVDIINILQNPPPLLSQEDRQDQVCTPWALWRSFEYCKFCLSKFSLDLGNH